VDNGGSEPLKNSLPVEGVVVVNGKVNLRVVVNGLNFDVLLKEGDEKGRQRGKEDVEAGQDKFLVKGLIFFLTGKKGDI